MAFEKGRSGNPGGRPKAEGAIRDIAQQYGPIAIHKLGALMNSSNPRVAIAACNAILDRAYGKPMQPIETKNDFTPEKFVQAMIEARERVARMRSSILAAPCSDAE